MPGYSDQRSDVSSGWSTGEDGWGGAVNTSLQTLATVGTHLYLTGVGTTTPPASPTEGEVHVVGASPTGAWSTYAENSCAAWIRTTADYTTLAWRNIEPQIGWLGYNITRGVIYFRSYTLGWLPAGNNGVIPDNSIEPKKLKRVSAPANGQVPSYDSATESFTWINLPTGGGGGTGDITSVTTSGGLTGGATSGDADVSIADAGVTTAKLADDAVETSKLSTTNTGTDGQTLVKAGDDLTYTNIADPNAITAIVAGTGISVTASGKSRTISATSTATGDITAVTAGTGLTGGGTSGAVTLNVANPYTAAEKTKLGGITAGAEPNVQANWTESSSSSDAYIRNKPTIPQGDITRVQAGTGLTGGGVSGDVTLNVAYPLPTPTGNANKYAAVNSAGTAYELKDAPSGGGGGTGDITAVTAGTGLTGGGTSGAVTLNVQNPILCLTLAAYNALLTKNANTIYLIT